MFTNYLVQNGPKIGNTQNLLKFGRFDILGMPISIHISKIGFIKYLPADGPKMISKLKMRRIYWNLAYDFLNMSISIFMSKIIFVKHLPPLSPKFVPKLKSSEFAEIWLIWYFNYSDLHFNVKINFYKIFTTC